MEGFGAAMLMPMITVNRLPSFPRSSLSSALTSRPLTLLAMPQVVRPVVSSEQQPMGT